MGFESIKHKLYNDHSLLISVLEDYGIHHIRPSRKYIQGCLPDGDNPHSFSVNLKSDYLATKIYTRNNFKGKDIIDALAFISHKDIGQIAKELSLKVGIRLDFKIADKPKDDLLDFLSGFTRYDRLSGHYHENIPISERRLDMFINSPHSMFTAEGIDIPTQDKFGVRYDILDNRIIIPIRDDKGRLITAKGRIAVENPSSHIAKYLAYFQYNADSILYGLYENKEEIMKKREVIIVEAEKSVLKADSMGVNNVVALSKKRVSEEQRKLILELQCDVVLAFDKDVTEEEVFEIAEQFNDYVDVYIIKDERDLLGKKDSPFDCGELTWDELYENKFKYII